MLGYTSYRDWSPGGGTQQQVSVVTTVWGLTTATQSGPHGGSVATGGGPGYGQQGPAAKQGSPFPGAYRQATPQGAAAAAGCGRAGVAHSRSHGQCWCVCCRGVVAPGAAGGGGGYGPPQAAAAAAAGGGMSGVAGGGGGGATPGGGGVVVGQGAVAGGGGGQEGGLGQQYHPSQSALSTAAMVAAATATATATATASVVSALHERPDMSQQFGQGSAPAAPSLTFEDLVALDAVQC